MFSYYGAKTKIVDHYPEPMFSRIVEPFAGSARYALRFWDREVILYEKFNKVASVWRYLIGATENDIKSLPDMPLGSSVHDHTQLCDEEKWLIGFHLRRGTARPSVHSGERSRWESDRKRIASDIHKVKHWTIVEGDFFLLHEHQENTTYFVDPPYMKQSHKYNHDKIDYDELKQYMIDHPDSEFIVCGNESDTWLDFNPLVTMQGTKKTHIEMIYHQVPI